jgi:hypothetical protein
MMMDGVVFVRYRAGTTERGGGGRGELEVGQSANMPTASNSILHSMATQ